jgi:hypothetical protein
MAPKDYRRYAGECYKWARDSKTDAERQQYLDLASAWFHAALLQDGKPPIAPLKSDLTNH